MRSRVVSAATVSVAALTCALVPIGARAASPGVGVTCPPGLGIGLAEEPRALLKDPRAKQYIIDFVPPGTRFTRKVVVCNGDSRPMTVHVFGDGATIHGGAFALDNNPGEHPVSQWVTVSESDFTLAPHTSRIVSAAVDVPTDTPRGEYYGGIVAQHLATGGQLGINARAGVRIYLAVGTGGLPKSDFTIDTLTAGRAADGTPYVEAQVHNIGARALDLSGTLKLSHGPGGLSAGPFPARLGTTLGPGQTEPVTVPLDKALPDGPWHARIDVQSGLLEHAAEGDITFPSAANTKAAPVKAKPVPLTQRRDVVIPIAIGLLLFLLILLLLLWWRRRRRRRKEKEEEKPARTSVVQ